MPATSAGMTWRGRCINFGIVIFSVIHRPVRKRCRAAHPGWLPSKLSVSNPSHPHQRVAERRNSQPRIAATVGLPCGETHPVCETGLPAHDADRRASRRSTAAFSLSLETAFWKRKEPFSRSP